jgi:hypothetical protein
VYAENRIYSSTDARIEGDLSSVALPPDQQLLVSADSISIISEGRTSIDAIAGAASLAASLAGGGSGTAVSIGLSLAFNSIDNDVIAEVSHARLVTLSGSVDMRALNAGQEVLPSLRLSTLSKFGINAAALDAAANTADPSCMSSVGQEWDYLSNEGLTELNDGDLVRYVAQGDDDADNDGRIYKYVGDDGVELDLGEVDYTDGDWEEVETEAVVLKDGYTVRIDELHSYAGCQRRFHYRRW